jgi:SSS family solute:Na+ symporter
LPAVLIALYTRFFNPWGLLAGWAAGIAAGTAMVVELGLKSSIYPLHIFGLTIPCYAALSALVLNIAVGLIVSVILNATSTAPRRDETVASDYLG